MADTTTNSGRPSERPSWCATLTLFRVVTAPEQTTEVAYRYGLAIRGSLPAGSRKSYPCGTRTGGLRRSFLALRA
jgi:hypothetical protein